MGDSGAQLGDNRAQLFSPNSVRLFLDIDLNIKDLKRWCQIKTPWSRIWTLILLGGRLHLLRRTESLYLGRWTLWGPVLDGRPDMVRHLFSFSKSLDYYTPPSDHLFRLGSQPCLSVDTESRNIFVGTRV